MPQSEHSPTTTSDRLLLAVLLVCVSVAAAYVAVMADGERVFPAPINGLIFTTLGTIVLGVLISRARDQIIRHVDRRQTVVRSALIQQGAQLAEVTGEIPRIELPRIELPQKPSPGPRDEELDGYAMGYADGLARKPIIGRILPFDPQRAQGS